MNKIVMILLLVISWGCTDADNRLVEGLSSLDIKLEDEKGRKFKAQTLNWWYPGKRENKYTLVCEAGLCSEWKIETQRTGVIAIHVDASVVKKEDISCWDLFTGGSLVDQAVQSASIVMVPAGVACTSQVKSSADKK